MTLAQKYVNIIIGSMIHEKGKPGSVWQKLIRYLAFFKPTPRIVKKISIEYTNYSSKSKINVIQWLKLK